MNHGRVLMLLLALYAGGAVAAQQLKIAAIALMKDQAVLDVDGNRRKLQVGQTSPEGVLLKSANAAEAEIVVGERTLKLKLDGRISGASIRSEAAKVIRLAPGPGGHYRADGQINGGMIEFIVDTGATRVVLNKHMAKQIGLQYRVEGKPGRIETASGVTNAYFLTLDRVQVEALALSQVEGVVVDGDYPSIALLGQSFLNRVDMARKGNLLELHER